MNKNWLEKLKNNPRFVKAEDTGVGYTILGEHIAKQGREHKMTIKREEYTSHHAKHVVTEKEVEEFLNQTGFKAGYSFSDYKLLIYRLWDEVEVLRSLVEKKIY